MIITHKKGIVKPENAYDDGAVTRLSLGLI
jgi:hypothetical protein